MKLSDIAALVGFEGKTYAVPRQEDYENQSGMGRLPDGRVVEYGDMWLESNPPQGSVKRVVPEVEAVNPLQLTEFTGWN